MICSLKIGVSIAVLAYDQDTGDAHDIGDAHELLRRAKGTLLEAQARGPRQLLVGSTSPGLVPVPDSEAITRRIAPAPRARPSA